MVLVRADEPEARVGVAGMRTIIRALIAAGVRTAALSASGKRRYSALPANAVRSRRCTADRAAHP